MRIYFVDELNKPIKCYSVLVCNGRTYTQYDNYINYIDVADSVNGQYNIKSITLFSSIDLDNVLPYSVPIFVNTFTTKQSIMINCTRIYYNDIDILTLFKNNQFKLGSIVNNRVVYSNTISNAVSELIPVAYSTIINSATSLIQNNRHRIVCYDDNLNVVITGLKQKGVHQWLFNDGTTHNAYITTTQIQDPTIKYVRIQIPLASNLLTLENLPTDEFLNELGAKGNPNKFNPVQNSIAFINRLKSAHNRKRG